MTNPTPLPPIDTAPALRPARTTLRGRTISIVPLEPERHAESIYQGSHGGEKDRLWDWLFDGPFPDLAAFTASLEQKAASRDPLFFAIEENKTGKALGHATYLRIEPTHKVIEVGNILYTTDLQRTFGASEAMYLMARHVFEDLGYRRYEWKCNARNAPSRRAALRLGFSFEGIFRQHMIVKGRNRDTAWFSMLDSEWPARKAAFERWMDPANFDADGKQKSKLGE